MNNGLTKDNLMQTLPSVLAEDTQMSVLGETAAEALLLAWDQLDLPKVYARIDELPEALLDILAADFGVAWYDWDAGVDVKRAIIRDSFYVHKHLGTVGAVKRALSDVWPSYHLQEWYEYGGEPYHFRVTIADGHFDTAKRDKALRYVEQVKNVRSWCDSIAAQSVGNIAVAQTGGYVQVPFLMPGDTQLTGANDIAPWALDGLHIVRHPEDVSVPAGTQCAFSVEVEGDGVTYQWQTKNSAAADWANTGITGNKTATLTPTPTAAYNGRQYRCVVTNAAGTLTSIAATLTVT